MFITFFCDCIDHSSFVMLIISTSPGLFSISLCVVHTSGICEKIIATQMTQLMHSVISMSWLAYVTTIGMHDKLCLANSVVTRALHYWSGLMFVKLNIPFN